MSEHASKIASFLQLAGKLKLVPRTGWLDRGIQPAQVESVAGHSWRVALMAWVLAGEVEGLDRSRVVLLALIHDLAEAVTGDLTPYDPNELNDLTDDDRRASFEQRQIMSDERKYAKRTAEDKAIAKMAADLPASMRWELIELWEEMSTRQTLEARFVKDLDRLETFLQSRAYLDDYPDAPMLSFLLEVQQELETPVLGEIRDSVIPSSPDG